LLAARCGDAEPTSGGIEHRPAFLGARQAQVEHDIAVDAAARCSPIPARRD